MADAGFAFPPPGTLEVVDGADGALVEEPVDGLEVFASRLGLPSVPAIAERMLLERDLALVESTGARYHADQITTARALPALARAKRNGLDITAGIGIYHSGVEWGIFDPPQSCSASFEGAAGNAASLLDDLATSTPPSCADAAGRFLGLSFAGWNVVAAGILATFAFRGATGPAELS